MKLGGGWVWRLLFLSSLAVAAMASSDEPSEADVLDGDGDMRLDEEEMQVLMADDDEEEEAMVTYKTPVPTGDVYFAETFDDGSLDRWQPSKTTKEDADDEIAKYDGKWMVEPLKENKVPGDQGLVLKSRAKHHAIAAMLDKPFVFQDEPLVVQYEVNFQDGIDCGGAYIKLLSDSGSLSLEQFHDRTPYTIMFGPDKCGEDYKLHFIFRHKNPLNKDMEEKHAKRADVDLKKFYTDKKTHLYTLVLNPDNSYEMFIDQSSVSRGNLLYDMVPPVNPPKEIDDPNDSKPDDWDERAKIPDPEAVKPDDWDEDAPAKIEDPDALKPEGWLDDEPEFVSDPNAEKPEDWDEEMDGEWEAPQVPNPSCETAPGCGEWKRPMINNPQYKGKWKAPLIDNPNYQGVWKPRKMMNPEYFEDLQPFRMTPFKALGLELWSMTSDIYFDNFIITSHKEVADRWASDSWGLKKLVASANEKPVDDYVYRRVDQPQSHIEEEEEEEEGGEADEEEKEAGAGEPAAGVTIICWCFNFAAVLSFTLIITAAFLFKAQDEGESQENNGQGDNQVGADNEEEEMEEEEEEEESEENKTPERTLEDEVRVSCSVCLW
uniref:Uncharacterized protein n=1 Tax=Xiphophorus couchianus TaxID=32473 RepID=A0A3B5M3A9_9TELE